MSLISLTETIRLWMRPAVPFWLSQWGTKRKLMSPFQCQSIWENSMLKTLLTFLSKILPSNMSLQWKTSFNIIFLMASESPWMRSSLLNQKKERSFFPSLSSLSPRNLLLRGSQSPLTVYSCAKESASVCLRWGLLSL